MDKCILMAYDGVELEEKMSRVRKNIEEDWEKLFNIKRETQH